MYEAFRCKLSHNLSGYLRGHSCCSALLKMTEDWRASLDRWEAVAAVAVDLNKAFDLVCHSVLLANLTAYGFSRWALLLMTEYVCERKQHVKLDNTYCQWRTVRTRVPQGSLLGPLLFNIYTSDLNYLIEGTSLRLYADTTAYASDTSPVVLEYIINSDLQVVCTWLQHNYLQINATKTQAMATGPVNYRYNVIPQDNNIELTDSLKILRVRRQRKLIHFDPQHEHVYKFFVN